MYAERPSRISGAVLWTSRPVGESRVIPDGCMDVLWFGDHLLVAGPDTAAQASPAVAGPVVGLRFAPGTAPHVLGVPARELRDQRVRLDALWGAGRVRGWEARLARADRRGAALEELAGRCLEEDGPSQEIVQVAGLCRRGVRVDVIADELGWSARTLHRRALDAFGYSAKTLTRILRFQRAVVLAQAGVRLSEVSARAGYADQPHLSREVRALTGRPASQLGC